MRRRIMLKNSKMNISGMYYFISHIVPFQCIEKHIHNNDSHLDITVRFSDALDRFLKKHVIELHQTAAKSEIYTPNPQNQCRLEGPAS